MSLWVKDSFAMVDEGMITENEQDEETSSSRRFMSVCMLEPGDVLRSKEEGLELVYLVQAMFLDRCSLTLYYLRSGKVFEDPYRFGIEEVEAGDWVEVVGRVRWDTKTILRTGDKG